MKPKDIWEALITQSLFSYIKLKGKKEVKKKIEPEIKEVPKEEWNCNEILKYTTEECYEKFEKLIEDLRHLLTGLELGLKSLRGYKDQQNTIIDYYMARHQIYKQIDNIFLRIILNNDNK